MGLFHWLLRRLFGTGAQAAAAPAPARSGLRDLSGPRRRAPRLVPLRLSGRRARPAAPRSAQAPYRLARLRWCGTAWLDLTQDGDAERLARQGLPVFGTPEELARWLGISLGRLAWLTHRFDEGQRPADERQAHYHLCWLPKRAGGRRLIEAPKPSLKLAQQRILREILDKVPPHAASHGFVAGRSILTNAAPHARQRVVVRMDLMNFYPSVGYNRVVAIFRSLGYCREAAQWLARLVTSLLPAATLRRDQGAPDLGPYIDRHLPQGAPTSPALANLSAFSLDLRLTGLARTFGANYTRYADDLTFSGDERFLRSLAAFIPLAEQVIRAERFRTNKAKRRILRSNGRQQVAGVVVNARPNVRRSECDRLKAILTNCVRRGPSTQNHERRPDFAAHLRGRVAHVAMLNPARGARLLALYDRIDWNR